MREILFRGKTERFSNWIEGSLIIGKDLESDKLVYLIAPLSAYYTGIEKVMPETVGQYTGLTANGTKIFEGDIVKIHYDSAIWGNNREVVFEEGQWFFKDNTISQKSYIGAWGNSVVEVIGNIHDNPELLGNE